MHGAITATHVAAQIRHITLMRRQNVATQDAPISYVGYGDYLVPR